MSEIQWILNLLMNYQLPDEVKKLCLDRIGEVEKKLNEPRQAPIQHAQHPMAVNIPPRSGISLAQARDEMLQAGMQGPMGQGSLMPPVIPQQQEVITSIGPGGSSTRGPNKLRGRL